MQPHLQPDIMLAAGDIPETRSADSESPLPADNSEHESGPEPGESTDDEVEETVIMRMRSATDWRRAESSLPKGKQTGRGVQFLGTITY